MWKRKRRKMHPVHKAPTNDFELWAAQNPDAPVKEWLAMQPAANSQKMRSCRLKLHGWLVLENKGKDQAASITVVRNALTAGAL